MCVCEWCAAGRASLPLGYRSEWWWKALRIHREDMKPSSAVAVHDEEEEEYDGVVRGTGRRTPRKEGRKALLLLLLLWREGEGGRGFSNRAAGRRKERE